MTRQMRPALYVRLGVELRLAAYLHRKVVAQHANAVQDVDRELLRQRVRLVTHDHAHAEVAHLRVLRNSARPGEWLRQPPDNEPDCVLREGEIVCRERPTASLRHKLRP